MKADIEKRLKNSIVNSAVDSAIQENIQGFQNITINIVDQKPLLFPFDKIIERMGYNLGKESEKEIIRFLRNIERNGESHYQKVIQSLSSVTEEQLNDIMKSDRKAHILEEIFVHTEYLEERIRMLFRELTNTVDSTKILTDIPLSEGVLDFPKYSELLANIIKNSSPRFTIGIFGEWGTGKTTLMLMIEKAINKIADNNMLTVWFNAWKYEREVLLALIPFLKVLEDALTNAIRPENGYNAPSLETLRDGVKRTLTALANSLKLTVGSTGISLEADAGKFTSSYGSKPNIVSSDPDTLYYNAFSHIERSLQEIKKTGNSIRIIVFIDDLDRCSPEKALEILESIKSFVDIEGFVYVLGMNYKSIDSLMKSKYGEGSSVTGYDYMEKIVQLPFQIPDWQEEDISQLLDAINLELKESYFQDEIIVNKKLLVKAVEKNPRDTKRFVNDLILAKSVFDKPVPNLIVVQALRFRRNWNKFLEFITPNERRRDLLKSYEKITDDIYALDKYRDDLVKLYPSFFDKSDPLRLFLDTSCKNITKYTRHS